MTIAQLEKRITALEKAVEELRVQIAQTFEQKTSHWWHDEAGRFANDPVFEEIVRLGREYRESLRPDYKKKKRAKAKAKKGKT